MNFDFQNVNDGNGQQQKHENGDPLQFLIEFDARLQATRRIHQLRQLQKCKRKRLESELMFNLVRQ